MDQPTVSPNATEPTESAEPNLAQAQMTVLAAWINRSGDPGDVQHLTAQHFPHPYARAYWSTILDNAAYARNENAEETLERARGSFPMARDGWQELWSHMLD